MSIAEGPPAATCRLDPQVALVRLAEPALGRAAESAVHVPGRGLVQPPVPAGPGGGTAVTWSDSNCMPACS